MKGQILLIESDPTLQAFWTEAFSREGFLVLVAKDEPEARRQASALDVDLVLLGSNVEGPRGLQFLSELKSELGNLVVVAPLSASVLRQELKTAEAWGGVTPPRILLELLTSAVREALSLKERTDHEFPELVGEGPAVTKVRRAIAQILRVETTIVLLQGETGTGKELVARVLHTYGSQGAGPFISVSCGQIPEDLFERKLLGYEQGTFAEAKQAKAGLLELADRGTLLLDEIGDAPPIIQAHLLTVLKEKRFRRLGGKKELESNLVLIAATNQDLGPAVEAGRFREDLYRLLSVFPITLPPLRERREDLLPLAERFIHSFAREYRKDIRGLTPSAVADLRGYHWPGNIRELKSLLERAVIIEPTPYITPQSLFLSPEQGRGPESTGSPYEQRDSFFDSFSLARSEQQLIKHALHRTQGNQTEAARLLGISRFALRNRIRKYELSS